MLFLPKPSIRSTALLLIVFFTIALAEAQTVRRAEAVAKKASELTAVDIDQIFSRPLVFLKLGTKFTFPDPDSLRLTGVYQGGEKVPTGVDEKPFCGIVHPNTDSVYHPGQKSVTYVLKSIEDVSEYKATRGPDIYDAVRLDFDSEYVHMEITCVKRSKIYQPFSVKDFRQAVGLYFPTTEFAIHPGMASEVSLSPPPSQFVITPRMLTSGALRLSTPTLPLFEMPVEGPANTLATFLKGGRGYRPDDSSIGLDQTYGTISVEGIKGKEMKEGESVAVAISQFTGIKIRMRTEFNEDESSVINVAKLEILGLDTDNHFFNLIFQIPALRALTNVDLFEITGSLPEILSSAPLPQRNFHK